MDSKKYPATDPDLNHQILPDTSSEQTLSVEKENQKDKHVGIAEARECDVTLVNSEDIKEKPEKNICNSDKISSYGNLDRASPVVIEIEEENFEQFEEGAEIEKVDIRENISTVNDIIDLQSQLLVKLKQDKATFQADVIKEDIEKDENKFKSFGDESRDDSNTDFESQTVSDIDDDKNGKYYYNFEIQNNQVLPKTSDFILFGDFEPNEFDEIVRQNSFIQNEATNIESLEDADGETEDKEVYSYFKDNVNDNYMRKYTTLKYTNAVQLSVNDRASPVIINIETLSDDSAIEFTNIPKHTDNIITDSFDEGFENFNGSQDYFGDENLNSTIAENYDYNEDKESGILSTVNLDIDDLDGINETDRYIPNSNSSEISSTVNPNENFNNNKEFENCSIDETGDTILLEYSELSSTVDSKFESVDKITEILNDIEDISYLNKITPEKTIPTAEILGYNEKEPPSYFNEEAANTDEEYDSEEPITASQKLKSLDVDISFEFPNTVPEINMSFSESRNQEMELFEYAATKKFHEYYVAEDKQTPSTKTFDEMAFKQVGKMDDEMLASQKNDDANLESENILETEISKAEEIIETTTIESQEKDESKNLENRELKSEDKGLTLLEYLQIKSKALHSDKILKTTNTQDTFESLKSQQSSELTFLNFSETQKKTELEILETKELKTETEISESNIPEILEKPDKEEITSEEEKKITKKHTFKDPSTYKEFVPQFTVRDSNIPTPSSAETRRITHLRSCNPHSLIATIDSILLILEGTLAGTFRISQNYSGSDVHPIVSNTMHSIRLALESLKHYFRFSAPERFEPNASIIRELMHPAINLFMEICPNLDYSMFEFCPPTEDTTEKVKHPTFLVTPRQINGMYVYETKPTPVPPPPPRIPLVSELILAPHLGAIATADGFIRLNLPYTFQVDITLDSALCVRNLRDKTAIAISANGNLCGITSPLVYAFRHGQVVDVNIYDEFIKNVLYAKINIRGIHFYGSSLSQNLQLSEQGINFSNCDLKEMDDEFISHIFFEHSKHGPTYYHACRDAICKSVKEEFHDQSYHFFINDIKISQYDNGHLIVNRDGNDYSIWALPEINTPIKYEKGIMRVATPNCRMMTSVISNERVHAEKFFLLNYETEWVYYNSDKIIVTNEQWSAEL